MGIYLFSWFRIVIYYQLSLSLFFHALTTAVISCLAALSISKTNYESPEHCCLPCPKSSQIWPYLSSSFFFPLAAHWLMNTVQTFICATTASTGPFLSTWLNSWKFTNQPASFALPSVHMHLLGQRSFSHAALSVCNSLPCKSRSSKTLPSFKSSLKSHLFKLCYSVTMSVCMTVCVCALFFLCFGSLLCNALMGCVLQFGEITHKKEYIVIIVVNSLYGNFYKHKKICHSVGYCTCA